MSRSILVTGCGGYLGSELTRKLLDLGNQVIGIDCLLYGEEPIKELFVNKNFRFVKSDVRDLVNLSKQLKDVDYVIALHGIVGAPAVSLDPDVSLEINRLSIQALAELCTIHGTIENFIFASSCSVYGDSGGKKATEKMEPNPLEDYAISKLHSEGDIRGVFPTATILRFGTLMGLSHRMRFDLVVNKFIAQACSGETITVNGSGQQKRPFLHVKDAIESILLALDNSMDGVYNVLSDNYSIRGMANVIRSLSGGKVENGFNSDNEDQRNYEGSVEKINRFGFKPKYGLEYAYREISNWMDLNKINYKDILYSNYDSLMFKKPFD